MGEARRKALLNVADALEANEKFILAENAKDVAAAEKTDLPKATLQRLVLKPGKIAQLARGCRTLAESPDPIGRVLRRTRVAEGLNLEQVAAPLGVLLIIFEARPDAMPQIAALALASGNGLLLKGGKEAVRSNAAIHATIVGAVAEAGLSTDLIGLVTTRDEIADLLKLDHLIDLVIPRGSGALVRHIQNNTRIPVLGHADGVCHVYVDKDADVAKVLKIVVDSKIDYPAACNAVETVLLHGNTMRSVMTPQGMDKGIFHKTKEALVQAGVTMHGGPKYREWCCSEEAKQEGIAKASELSAPPALKHEYGDLGVTIELVDSMEEAIDYIHANGSGHTDAIITENPEAAAKFLSTVDSA